MKKIFLPLLAALGMVVGMTLTSCGGGGGNSAKQVDITGLHVVSGSGVPQFMMTVDERMGDSNVYRVTYSFGGDAFPGSLAVQMGYPLLNDDGMAQIKATMGIDNMRVLQDSNFMAWIGAKHNAQSVQLDSLIELDFELDKKTDTGSMTRTVTGVYFVSDSSSLKLPDEVVFDSMYVTGATKIFKNLSKNSGD
ncbi:MAG: hypothetical protein E7032_04265 [Akkermansiaceae bacterium]|nr:hypothetical protein [Akkermansiaceae bacterium]